MAKRRTMDRWEGAARQNDNKNRFKNGVTALIHKYGGLVGARYHNSYRIDRI